MFLFFLSNRGRERTSGEWWRVTISRCYLLLYSSTSLYTNYHPHSRSRTRRIFPLNMSISLSLSLSLSLSPHTDRRSSSSGIEQKQKTKQNERIVDFSEGGGNGVEPGKKKIFPRGKGKERKKSLSSHHGYPIHFILLAFRGR